MPWSIHKEWYGREGKLSSSHVKAVVREIQGHSVHAALSRDGEVVMHKRFPSFEEATAHMEKHVVE